MKPFNTLSSCIVNKCDYSSSVQATEEGKASRTRLQPSLNSLYEWFSGFSDGESSSFYFRSNLVEYEFQIGLQKDDLAVLLFIQEKLGKVYISKGIFSMR